MARKIYLIGSLRNPEVPRLGNLMRERGHEVFDDWFTGGPEADDHWKAYHVQRGHSFKQAMLEPMARHIFSVDLSWLTWADTAVLLCPAGKSAHLEMGWMVGQGKDTVAFVDDPDRWDVMYQFLWRVVDEENELMSVLDLPRGAPQQRRNTYGDSNIPAPVRHIVKGDTRAATD